MEEMFDVSKFEIQELESIEAPISSSEAAGIAAGLGTTAVVAAGAAILAD
jgi:hypothetical protein